MELPPYPSDNIPYYPSPLPLPGNDRHTHIWRWYRLDNSDNPVGSNYLIVACSICGVTRRDTLTRRANT